MASLSAERLARPDLSLATLVGASDETELVDLAVSEGIAGPAARRLAPLLGESQGTRLVARALREALRHLNSLVLLQRVAAAFDEAGLTWVVLKGPVLAELSYGRLVRGYTDLDLMVSARELQRAVRALQGAGAGLAERDWRLLVANAKGQLGMIAEGSGAIDLHWHLVYLRSARERWLIQTDELLERRRRVQLGPVTAWGLDAEDFAAHVFLHASFAGAQQLKRLLDIERTVANQCPDWDELVRRCLAWRVGLPVSVMLNRSKVTLGAAVPEGVIRVLAGGQLGRLVVRELGTWVPSGHIPGGRSVKNGLMRSLRDGVPVTAAEFAAETWRTLGKLLRPGAIPQNEPRVVVSGPAAAAGLESYLRLVEGTDRYGHLCKPQGAG